MSGKISRRRMLAAGVASTGMLMGVHGNEGVQAGIKKYAENKGPGREAFWEPGPDKNLVRDLTPGSTPIRLAGFLNYEEGASPADAVKKLRDDGFTGALAAADTWNSMRESVVQELRDALREYDVVVFEIGGYCNMIDTDESVRRNNLKRLALCLETADRIGCPMVGTISGSRDPDPVSNYAAHPDNWTLETWKLLIKSIKQVFRDTAGMKAAIGMEAQITTNIDTPLAHRRIIDDVGSDRLKVNLDPTNMVHLSNHFHTTDLINECFDILGEDIYGCHAKDSYVLPHSQTVHVQEVCPGRGSLDYETFLVRLSRMKWPRSLLPEHIPQDQFPEAYAYIRKIAEKVGVKIHS